jgi:hypothetical protein
VARSDGPRNLVRMPIVQGRFCAFRSFPANTIGSTCVQVATDSTQGTPPWADASGDCLNLVIVSFDAGFDRTAHGWYTPGQVLTP